MYHEKSPLQQLVNDLIDQTVKAGELPTVIAIPKGTAHMPHTVRIPLPVVRRGSEERFLTHEIRIVPVKGNEVSLSAIATRVTDRIEALVKDCATGGRELEAIELTDYEAACLMVEQRERITYFNAHFNPEDTEWKGVFMGIPLRLGKSLETNDF